MRISQQSPRTLAQYVKRAAWRTVTAMCFLGAFAAAQHVAPVPMDYAPHPATTTAPALPAGCWNGEAPADMAGKIPGHVVVTVDGETRTAGERMVGKALGQLFDGEQHGLTVHGFCR